ncbi:MAG: DEAD/DEAH box helicase [Treponema sp.]|nr:DEAD/DEAH box helicase [Treponema sp.]
MKNLYGITPWGRWFIDVLDSYQMGERLERGRRYANAGKVLSLEFKDGKAIAKVEGNYNPFYKVIISFPPLAEAEKVYKSIEKDPQLLARIAAGELPESFLQKLKKDGIDLIPRQWREMKRSCTCPDYGDPCKHMAALYYIIAGEIDANPHVLFHLRGMDLAGRFGKAVVHKIPPPFTITFSKEQMTEKTTPNELLEFEEIPYCGELITSLLPSEPPFCKRDFSAVMAEFYHRCASIREWESALDEDDSIELTEHDFSRSVWTVHCPNLVSGVEPSLLAQDINGAKKRYTLNQAFNYFVQFSSEDGTASYSFLFYLFKFLNLACSSGTFIPFVVHNDDDTIKIVWRPFENLPLVSKMLNLISQREHGMLSSSHVFKINLSKKQVNTSGMQTVSGRSVVDILSSAFLSEWVRNRFMLIRNDFYRDSFKNQGSNEYKQLLNLFFMGMFIDVSAPAKRSLPVAIDRWLSVLHIDFSAYHYAINIKDFSGRDGNNDANVMNFAISMDVITEEETSDQGFVTKKTPLSKIKDLEILRAPIALSNYLPEIKELFSNQKIALSETRLVSFLDTASSLLSRLGITINLPKTLAKELKPRLVIKGKTEGASLVSYLDLDSLQEFEWQIAIGDDIVSIKEFEKLVKLKRAMVRFRNGFVKMQADELVRLLKKAKTSVPNTNDFLKAHFTGDSVLAFDERETINKIFKEHNYPIPATLNASLRPYQVRGYNWICSLMLSGFGCILADDMGLGKTIQSITAILRLKEDGLLNRKTDGKGSERSHGCLVVAPAALLNNWEKEFSRFAPSLIVTRYHGYGRRFDKKSDVFLTTYQTTVRDAEKLKKMTFSLLLVDEAHLMKNTQTRISRTVKNLRSVYRLALSGTPVENRLEDLRSLFDFILPGYLGDVKTFKDQYRYPIEVDRSREKAEALQKITSPFLLRRLKTDKNIIKDLPEKIVTNEYAVLEKEQAVLYKSVVAESMNKSKEIEPKERSSLIFYLLTSLKQICNHPRVYDKESPATAELSGKAQLLVTLLQEILANKEKTLVFSQYVETLDCLDKIIKKELGEAALIYHGGLSQEKRTETINKFQNDPGARILLISLKAGGLGLNLTAASRVIHYDLWYNPAVENQATDRAFRIGQKRAVFVHRFITKNSFEEKIDAMISAKQELADMTVKSGESWLAKMSHEELKSIFER